ncbi:hypothetical protein Golax_011754 [Gossypium laxum]|uniref:Uncharacterized protein n=1 Tax=Gossypium laxum TaxID=34288 RepID=A0A7J8ZM37_9ROSI|nr:hypothetical protein [Gossypium laxum]
MLPHKFKDCSMVKIDIDVRVANATMVENIGIIARMSKDTKRREADCQIASFDSECFTLNEVDMVPTIEEYSTLLYYDFRDPLRIYWKQNVDFRGPLANLTRLPVDMVKVRLKDKNGPCISCSDIRDAMGMVGSDRHLTFFVFAI